MPTNDCTAIIVAAGSSRRMGFDKLLWPLAEQPVLLHSIRAFESSPSISSIIVVCPTERWEELASPDFSKPVVRVDGGKNRQDSVRRGLDTTPTTSPLVAVHDGARPLASPKDIERCVDGARAHQAAALARRVTETVKRSNSSDFTESSISRDQLWLMETPQVFETELLKSAYATVSRDALSITDEVSALEAIGKPTKLIEASHPNLKITTRSDLVLANALFHSSKSV